MTKNQYCIYVVHFSDGRIKFGITKNLNKRMSYYRQEARRNNVDGLVWWAAKPFEMKSQALHAERTMRLLFRDNSRKYQREWLTIDANFLDVMETAEELREYLGIETEVEKKDLPYLGSHGHFFGLTSC